ncbi:MAG: hypothetical protein M3Q23_05625 [Actinomycetota bacterium]|nr:hypothetical protein [Actinomycetota bacterium]
MTGLALEGLTERITDWAGRLEGPAEAAALIESLHVKDDRGRPLAPEQAHELGTLVFEHQTLDPPASRRAIEVEESRRRAWLERRAALGVAGPSRQPALVLPAVLVLASVPVLTLPWWTGGRAAPAKATAIGLGALAATAVAGGFRFVLHRIVSDSSGSNPRAALGRWVRTTARQAATTAVAGLALWGILVSVPTIPQPQVGRALLAYTTLSVLWASLGVGAALGRLRRSSPRATTERRPTVPSADAPRRTAVLFAYGLALATFLMADRLMAWAGTPHRRSLHLWFRADYELALGVALLCSLPAFVVVAAAGRQMVRLVARAAFVCPLPRRDQISARLGSSLRRTARRLAVVGVAGAIAGAVGLGMLGRVVPSVGPLVTARSLAVFGAAMVSYVLLAWSLLNQGLAFALSREDFALWAVAPALLVDLAVGIGLGHFVAYRLAVLGLLAGAVVCSALSTRFGRTFVRDADYLFYAGF